MEPDFSGWATKAGLPCSDGRTIMPGAFQHQDKVQVPLVWQHGHTDVTNVLGHVQLENRDEGVYAHAFFNDTPAAQHAKKSVQHKDINAMSIWANQLVERSKKVMHGMIKEVSLVLAGANPGALIENINIVHADGTDELIIDEAVITTGLEFEHVDDTPSTLTHEEEAPAGGDDEKTVGEVYETLNDEQKELVQYLVGEAATSGKAEHDGVGSGDDNNTLDHGQKEGSEMGKRNVFDRDGQGETGGAGTLRHTMEQDDVKAIFDDLAKNKGSLRHAMEAYAEEHLEHGINDIDMLFPEAKTVTTTPEFFARRMEWVNQVFGGATKRPWSRIKSMSADLTFDEARAKGYIKGNLKKEEFFGLQARVTTPQTVYKKQKLDRDDIIDITDFDIVVWMKAEMRIMLDEEIARAILLGDGREADDEDKIKAPTGESGEGIRPIAYDDELYTSVLTVNINDSNSSVQEVIDAIVMGMAQYRGSGSPTFFTTAYYIARFKLLKDSTGRRIYANISDLAAELGVGSIVPVEAMEGHEDLVGVIVNMSDYSVGADRGGAVALFDDFDIDYNQYKYLIETRISGALTKLKSAIAIFKTDAANVLVVPNEPTFDGDSVTIVNQTGVVYKNGAGTTINAAGSPYAVAPDEEYTVNATPAAGYYFGTSDDDSWTYIGEA